MSNELNPQEPAPPNPAEQSIPEPTPLAPEEGRGLFARISEATLLSLGGLLTFAVLVTPARAKGASCSSKLKWEQRNHEIEQTIAASALSEINSTPAPNADGLVNPISTTELPASSEQP